MMTENGSLAHSSDEVKATDSPAEPSTTMADDNSSVPWSHLSLDLIQVIFGHCTFIDYFRASSVFYSWASIAAQKHPPVRQLPWLMIPLSHQPNNDKDKAHSNIYNFFSPFDDQFHCLPIPDLHKHRCCGSSEGWIITVDDHLNIALLNPFSRVQIQLPSQLQCPIPIVPWQEYEKIEYMRRTPFFIRKAILSSDPSTNKDCIVVAITAFDRLMFCRPGDEHWAIFDGQHDAFEDLTFFMGRLCTVNNIEGISSCDFGPEPRSENLKVAPLRQIGGGRCQRYLVESCGRLLMVLRYFGKRRFYSTIGFEVYKLEVEGPSWVEVRSLGDQMLFLGVSHSESYSARRFSSPGFRGNCIYFTGETVLVEGDKWVEFMGPCHLQDIGVFSLDDGSIAPFCFFYSNKTVCSPIWVKPNPW